ncbi:MAG: hypothetical protein ACOCP4_04925 [Candidatus Woesearchaeota archaeon]
MNIAIPLILVIVGILFYSVSYVSPKTDVLFYGISAVLFLIAGVLGILGYNETEVIGNSIEVEEIENKDSITYDVDYNREYRDVPYLPMLGAVFVLLSIYQFSAIATEFRRDTNG